MTQAARPALTLLRHARVDLPSHICFGWTDVGLSSAGRDRVFALAQNWVGPRPHKIICSDLLRSYETASILADNFSIPVQRAAELREVNFGDWEGRSWDDIHRNDTLAMQRWGENWQTVGPPGGESGEQLQQRVITWYRLLCSESKTRHRTLVTAHAGSLRALSCYLQNQSLDHFFDHHFEHAVPHNPC